MTRAYLAISLLAAGCNLAADSGSSSVQGQGQHTSCVRPDRGINNGPLPDGCTKIENEQIGQPQTLTAGGTTIEITGWITKDGEDGEYVGFTYTASAAAYITIKAGGETFVEDGDGTWTHPAGTIGPEASAISNIVVCEEEPVDDGEDGDGNNGGGNDCPDDGEPDPVDTDGDGDPDLTDPDDDNDGVPDEQDPDRDGDGQLDDPNQGEEDECTSNEDCASGLCTDGICVEV